MLLVNQFATDNSFVLPAVNTQYNRTVRTVQNPPTQGHPGHVTE